VINRVIDGLEHCAEDGCKGCSYIEDCNIEGGFTALAKDALELLKAQEPATIEPKCIELDDKTKAWLDKMDAVNALNNIADICIDWDGYRTADGLGGLINEIWAYARYCAAAQEPIAPILDYDGHDVWLCGNCHRNIFHPTYTQADEDEQNYRQYCFHCGRKVKWNG